MTEPATTTNAEKDPAQLILPYVDTSIEVYGPLTIGDLALFVPTVLAIGGAFGALLIDLELLAWVLVVAAAVLGLSAGAIKLSTEWYTSAGERLRNWYIYCRRRWSLPYGHGTVGEEAPHGVRRLHDDGTAEMADGRYVGLVRVEPTNTGLQTTGERNALASQLSSVVDEEIKDFDFRLFATTVDPDPELIVGPYEHRAAEGLPALAADRQVATYQRALLRNVADWYRETDTPQWGARHWRYYVIVDAAPEDVDAAANPPLRTMLNPLASHDSARFETQVEQTLTDRLQTVIDGLSGITGLDAVRVDAGEHATLLTRYWTGRAPADEAAVPGDTVDEQGPLTPTERRLAPDSLDATRRRVEVGDQYCRTFWIAEWPVNPESLFLRELFTMRRVDIDVCIHVRAADKRRKVADLEQTIADIDSEAMERSAASDVSAMDVEQDIDAYIKFRELLRSTSTQPWSISGYVTVRADTEAALARVEQAVETYDDTAHAKTAVLDDATADVRTVLESSPADCWVVPPGTRQLEAFQACAPTSRDPFAATATADKTTTVPGGAIGAMFPFCATGIRESAGMDWGRNEQNGAPLKADPFQRGAAPHMMTIGQSRSGKTYAATKAAARWYAQSDEHTLIVCDTQSGFDGLTDLLGGRHIVVDGTQTINPLDIQPVPEHVRTSTAAHVDPYRMKIDEATQFVAGILRAQGIDPGPYVATIEEGLEATYDRAGIQPNDLDSHARESPTLADFIATLDDMLSAPADYTHTGHDAEVDQKVRRVSDLLDKLSGFKEGGKYHHMVGETETSITDPTVDMAYLDLQQLQGQSDAEKSVMLQLMLSQVYETVKRTDGKLVFMIDEAHVLLHSDAMVEWLQQAAREWARFDAAMWFISQSPREFVQQSTTKAVGQENHRRTIADQCSTIHFFRTPRVAPETLAQFGMNDRQIRWVRDEATPGKAGAGYAECLTHFEDHRGWFPTYVEAAPFEHDVLTYARRDHGDFRSYLADRWDGLHQPEDTSVETTATTGSPGDQLTRADGPPKTEPEPHADGGTDYEAMGVETIDGIGPTYAERLRAADIDTVADLADHSPRELAAITDASPSRVQRWVVQLDGD